MFDNKSPQLGEFGFDGNKHSRFSSIVLGLGESELQDVETIKYYLDNLALLRSHAYVHVILDRNRPHESAKGNLYFHKREKDDFYICPAYRGVEIRGICTHAKGTDGVLREIIEMNNSSGSEHQQIVSIDGVSFEIDRKDSSPLFVPKKRTDYL